MEFWVSVTLISLFVGGFLIVLAAMIWGFLLYRRDRLLSHAESMKALEMGRDLPARPEPTPSVPKLEVTSSTPRSSNYADSLPVRCDTITGWTAGSGLLFAFWASGNPVVACFIAGAAAFIGVTGMICGTILPLKRPADSEYPTSIASKPQFDPETI